MVAVKQNSGEFYYQIWDARSKRVYVPNHFDTRKEAQEYLQYEGEGQSKRLDKRRYKIIIRKKANPSAKTRASVNPTYNVACSEYGTIKAFTEGGARKKFRRAVRIDVEKETETQREYERKHKRNSSVSDFKDYKANKLSALAKQFQGQHNGQQRRVAQSNYTPKQTYRLGHLVQMKVKHNGSIFPKYNGKIIPINFDGDQAYLAADFKNGLHVVGKDAIIKDFKSHKNGLTNIGKLVQVDYVTNKNHIGNNETIRFYHKLGEATKEMPNLLIDNEGFPIITGGAYDVWDVGIVN